MIDAFIRGKLSRDIECMEDVLTSNVFGLFRYLAPEDGLLPFLSLAEDACGTRPLSHLRGAVADSVDLEFWPLWKRQECAPCEPDVVARIDTTRQRFVILVEAKYMSGKSSNAAEDGANPHDQLAREWDNLVRVANEEGRTPLLVYLTTAMGFPHAEIAESVRDWMEKRPDSGAPQFLWLSWRVLDELFGHRSPHAAQRDLARLARRLGLVRFTGLLPLTEVPQRLWTFSAREFQWGIGADGTPLDWRFGNG